MKTYVSILLIVVGLFAVVFGGYVYMKKQRAESALQMEGSIPMKLFTGTAVRVYEGDNKLAYSFNIPATATTTVEMDGSFIKVTDATSSYTTIYISYEGGRGFGPLDYLDGIIVPLVSVINPVGTTTIGSYEWLVAESVGSEWHIASVANGAWLVIVENKKTVHDLMQKTLESLKAQ